MKKQTGKPKMGEGYGMMGMMGAAKMPMAGTKKAAPKKSMPRGKKK